MIVVHPSLPVKSMQKLIALARARPGARNFSASPGSPNHLALEMVNVMARVKLQHIRYKGAGPVITNLLGGHLHCASLAFPGVTPHAAAKRLGAIAVTDPRRSAPLSEVPTVAESALPGFNVTL